MAGRGRPRGLGDSLRQWRIYRPRSLAGGAATPQAPTLLRMHGGGIFGAPGWDGPAGPSRSREAGSTAG